MEKKLRPVGSGLYLAAILSLTAASAAHAIVIDQATFRQNGGDPSNVAGTIQAANKKLSAISNDEAWLSVGRLELTPSRGYRPGTACTATWIGNQGQWSYFMTATHCLDLRGGSVEAPVSARFTDWRGQVVAGGNGTAYVPDAKLRVGIPVMPQALADTASSQMAIVKLPLYNYIMGSSRLAPLEPPILNDIGDEAGRDTMIIGYGTWGVGRNMTSFVNHPALGAGRLYGRTQVDKVSADGGGLSAIHQPVGPSSHWAQVTGDDGGAPWWQIHGTRPTLVAVTDAGQFEMSAAARVSKFAGWIKSVFPQARFLSQVKPRACLVNVQFGTQYCLPAGQESYNGDRKWPVLFSGWDVRVQADDGVAVRLSTNPRLDAAGIGKSAQFFGTTDTDRLRHVKANNGEYLNFSQPNAMRVTLDSKPLGCIVSLDSAQKYCLPAGQPAVGQLPAWIKGQAVFVQADPGVAVRLSDRANFAYNRVATFSGTVDHDKLLKVRADNGEDLDFSRPVSMEVIQH
ncbi:hypothetical protein [Burkholderia plantarii]|uniref:hypothetical protein n=1 Tax=Burkholderia plantarii TaxID=41899 RepID=UPI0006D894EF|nr:hypothetical protein [Burkholderia plantarii]GLZ23270.1 hypothetical protein Bpla01_67980 [Burkholderia plantarii]